MAIYAALATGCCYPFAVIDAMTLAETEAIFGYWAEHPPIYLMVQAIARMLGWKPTQPAATSLDDLAAMAPLGLAVAPGSLGMPVPELDIDALRARNRARLSKGSRNG